MSAPDPKNRLNDLDSRRWLQFQKSWFISEGSLPIREFIAFFTKRIYPDGHACRIALYPSALKDELPSKDQRERCFTDAEAEDDAQCDYALIDLRDITTLDRLREETPVLERLFSRLKIQLRENCYLTVACRNHHENGRSESVAWELARMLRRYFTQKDEKIGCIKSSQLPAPEVSSTWQPHNNVIYFLQFRNESTTEFRNSDKLPQKPLQPAPVKAGSGTFRDGWFIHKPPPRPKNVLLHPAKFPEDLVQKYIATFTDPGEWVFDPMTGTGSTLVAALESERRACGIELNPEFVEIAKTRFPADERAVLVSGDARSARSYAGLPEQLDYCITSPPYWDMLRMRGAETQAKRKAAGLQRWYSDDPDDLGNIAEYDHFLDLLEDVYRLTAERLRPGRFMTIIVKNVKKKGVIYPLSWDIAERLQKFLVFSGEQFWCQDDQRLAPFGYRYAWVSNTFHHYCLTFQKPE